MTVQTTNTDPLSRRQQLLREQHVVSGHHYFRKVAGIFTCECGQQSDGYGNLIS